MRPLVRAAALVGLALGLSLVPVRQAAACDCAWLELPQAIAEADVAVVATLEHVVGDDPDGMAPMTMTWSVARSRDPLDDSRLTVRGWRENGANCGVSFGVDERWLLLAYRGEEGLETNGCLRSTRIADAQPEETALIEELVATPVLLSAPTEPETGAGVPAPLLVAVGAIVVVGLASLAAFRRGGGTA